jgi:hypothetical protein
MSNIDDIYVMLSPTSHVARIACCRSVDVRVAAVQRRLRGPLVSFFPRFFRVIRSDRVSATFNDQRSDNDERRAVLLCAGVVVRRQSLRHAASGNAISTIKDEYLHVFHTTFQMMLGVARRERKSK